MLRRLEEIPAHWARLRADHPVLHDGASTWTWRELDAARASAARRLQALGVRAGDRVMVVGENCASMVLLLFALPSIDAWTVNVNARLTARELDAIAAHARPRRVIYLTGASSAAREHADRRGAHPVDLEGWGEALVSEVDEASAAEPVDADPATRVAALLYTTGTTGEPKGVMLTHAGFMHIARLATELRGLVPGDRIYGLLPFTHVYGMASVVYGSLCSGAGLDLQARFSPEAMAHALEHRGITVCQGVPAMYAKLLEHLRATGEPFSAPQLRFLYAGAHRFRLRCSVTSRRSSACRSAMATASPRRRRRSRRRAAIARATTARWERRCRKSRCASSMPRDAIGRRANPARSGCAGRT